MNEELVAVLEELKQREPIFHQPELCATRALLEQYAAPDFWEVGASGRVYSRELVIDTVETRFRDNTEPDTSRWETSEFDIRQLAADTYMVTYRLKQEDRTTRRLSIWRRTEQGWQVAYHQGTIVAETG